MENVGGAKISLVRYHYSGMETSSYRTMEDLILHLLTSNGSDFIEIVKNKLLPEAERLWQEDREENEKPEEEMQQGTESYWVGEMGDINF